MTLQPTSTEESRVDGNDDAVMFINLTNVPSMAEESKCIAINRMD